MRQITATSSFVLLVCLVAACSGTSPSVTAAPVPKSQATDSEVNAICNGYQTCCGSQGFAFNATACDANARALLGPDVCPAPRIYDPQAAADCFADMQAAYASCSIGATPSTACSRMCSGATPVGSACTSNQDCAASANGIALCEPAGTGSTGSVCTIEMHGKTGDACDATCKMSADGSSSSCYQQSASSGNAATAGVGNCFTSDGIYCASDNTCRSLIAVGTACIEGSWCVQGANCDFATSKCVENLALGASCSQALSVCVDGAYCSAANVCATKKAAGAACASSSECLGYCDGATQLCATDGPPGSNVTATDCANPTPK